MGYEIADGSEAVVFVYGTLLRGESNHFRLSAARYLGEARTAPSFDLVDMGGFPALIEGGASSVSGEVYAISRDTLSLLDELEDHPSFYCRQPVVLSDESVVMAYVLPRRRAGRLPRIVSGSWKARAGA